MRFWNILCLIPLFTLAECTLNYDVSMTLHVPRVYDNSQSLGHRKYQTQHLSGTLSVTADSAEMTLVNRTHRVGGERVSYLCEVGAKEWHLVGSNRTGSFRKPSVHFEVEALPSYIPSYEPTDDETLVLSLSGSGTGKTVKGAVSGTLGCGCSWYGHVSPTRDVFTGSVVDKAAVWGTFKLKRK